MQPRLLPPSVAAGTAAAGHHMPLLAWHSAWPLISADQHTTGSWRSCSSGPDRAAILLATTPRPG